MRSLVRPGALSAIVPIVLVIAVLGTACTADTDTTIGADAPETESTQEQPTTDPGVAVDPLPTATPTVKPDAQPGSSLPTFDRVIDQDLDRDGRVSAEERDQASGENPTVFGYDARYRVPDLASIDYQATPAGELRDAIPGFDQPSIVTNSTTPDGASIWIGLPGAPDNFGNPAFCGEGTGTRLGRQILIDATTAIAVRPIDALPVNVSEIHHGPNDRVLLYTTCEGETRPAAFATVQPDGNFTDVVAVDPLLAATTSATTPVWKWGQRLPADDYFAVGSLIAIVPQQGLVATDADPDSPALAYLDAETGRVLEVWQTPQVWRVPVGYDLLTSDGRTAMLGDPIDLLGSPISTITARQPAGPGEQAQALIGGRGGGVIVSSKFGDVTIERIGGRPISVATWAPVGPWIALSGPAAGTWLYGDGQTVELSDVDAEALYFSPDGSTLVIATATQQHIIRFARAPLPSDDQVTAFSTLDSGGLGPIRVEATVSSLREELGLEFELYNTDGIEPGYCVWVDSPSLPGVSMLAEAISADDAVITSVVVDAGPWTTPSGLRVGSNQLDVYGAFPDQLREEPHKYAPGNYLTFEPTDPNDNYSVKFETNGNQVTRMHAGRKDWIALVEGCA